MNEHVSFPILRPAPVQILLFAFFAFVAMATFDPAVAWACPSCANLQDANRQAFVNSTVFLSLMPVGMIAAIVIWVWRKMRQGEAGIDTAG